jgi:uncharacterized membrane protein
VITVTAIDTQLIRVKVVCFTVEIVIVVAVNVIVVAIITSTTTTTTTTTRHLKGVSFLFYCNNMWCVLVFLMLILYVWITTHTYSQEQKVDLNLFA